MTEQQEPLPVIISGAGPCGLVVALTLQQERKLPFVIIEKASRERFCSDVGSGFDLAPTAVDILKNRLQIPDIDSVLKRYAGMHMNDMHGNVVRELKLLDISTQLDFASASRSNLQQALMNALTKNQTEEEINEFLKCGMEVTNFQEQDTHVTVELSDGSSIQGCALLGCDGIHSRVRKCMVGDSEKDALNFCNTTCWWGKTKMKEGSDLQIQFDKTQKFKSEGTSFVWSLGSHKEPGSFMVAPIAGNTLVWAFFVKSKQPPARGNDLVRRGGFTLAEEEKQELIDIASNRFDLMKLSIRETDASNITKVGLFDRDTKNILKMPFANGQHVALLGDAAHPQSPFMGQGVNMAIVDAFVCATLLNRNIDNVPTALRKYNSDARRKSVAKVVQQARNYGDLCVSKSRFTCWLFRMVMHWAPMSLVIADMMKGDESNHDFVQNTIDNNGP